MIKPRIFMRGFLIYKTKVKYSKIMDKTKILAKNPFKMKNKLEKELTIIQKIVDTTTKKVEASELDASLASDFEGLLLKTKDPIQAWVRGNALEQLGFIDAALLFKNKAAELGYVVENINTNENMEDNVKTFECTVKFKVQSTIADVEDVRSYVFKLLSKENIDTELYDMTVTAAEQIPNETNENTDKPKCACGENEECTCPQVVEAIHADVIAAEMYSYYNQMIDTGNSNTEALKMTATQFNMTPQDVKDIIEDAYPASQIDENAQADLYAAFINAYPMSEVLQNNLKRVIDSYLSGDGSNEMKEETVGALAAITGDTVENIDALLTKVMTGKIIETFKQQFMYSPQEETKWKIFEDDAVIEKPKFNAMALRHMISDDAFLKFCYHNLSTGVEDKDLELIYNTYIKSDDDMMNKLKTYESYTSKVLEGNINRDSVAQSIADVLTDLNIELNDEIKGDIINRTSAAVKENITTSKSAFNLYTADIKNELRTVFKEATINSIVTKLGESKITVADDKNVLSEKASKAFGLSNDGANYVVKIIESVMPRITEMAYIGSEPTTYLFGIGTAITLLSSLGLPVTK